jgi:hypothetical protein
MNFYTDDSSHEIKVENLNSENETEWMNSFKRKVNYDKYQNDKKQIMMKENEENEEPDISDTEIDGYLRSENEVKIYKKLQKRAKRMCENSI